MKIIGLIALVVFLLVQAQAEAQVQTFEVDECSRPGELISKSFSHIGGDEARESFKREGTLDISEKFNFSTKLTTNVYRFYEEEFCKRNSYIKKVKKCEDVDPKLALGKGSKVFRVLFDFRQSLTKRADFLRKRIPFGRNLPETTRLEVAHDIVVGMVDWSTSNSMPESANEYEEMILDLYSSSIINQFVRDEFLVNGTKKTFGFVIPRGVEIVEEKGNQKFKSLFDFNISLYDRADTASELFHPLRLKNSRWLDLVKSLSRFANQNGLPSSWGEVLLMLKAAERSGVIKEGDHKKIIFQNEVKSRKRIGFQIKAQRCSLVEKKYYANKIEKRETRDLERVETKKIKIVGKEGILLLDEKELFEVKFDGVNDVTLKVSSLHNKYDVEVKKLRDNSVLVDLHGKRIRKSPVNTVDIELALVNNKYQLRMADSYKYLKYVKNTSVKVTFYRSRPLWADKKIKTMSFTLDDSRQNFLTEMKKLKKKVYVKFEISRNGEFFNNNFSRKRKSNKI